MLAAVRFRTLAPALALAVALACRQEPDAPAAAPARPAAVADRGGSADARRSAQRRAAQAHARTRRAAAARLLGLDPRRPALRRRQPARRSAWCSSSSTPRCARRPSSRRRLQRDRAAARQAQLPDRRGRHRVDPRASGGVRQAATASTSRSSTIRTPRSPSKLGLRVPVALLGVDAEGYVIFGLGQFAVDEPRRAIAIEAQIREALRLPARPTDAAEPGSEASRSPRPSGRRCSTSKEGFDLASQRGKPLVLIFFLHTCPHCHDLLALPEGVPADAAGGQAPAAGRGRDLRAHGIGAHAAAHGRLRLLPGPVRSDGKIRGGLRRLRGRSRHLPDRRQGRIVEPHAGLARPARGPAAHADREARRRAGADAAAHQGLQRQRRLRRLPRARARDLDAHASTPPPSTRWSRTAPTRTRSASAVTWSATASPAASRARRRRRELEDVGCETCHGRGGPHLSPDFVSAGNYAARLRHAVTTRSTRSASSTRPSCRASRTRRTPAIAKLPLEEKRKLLAARGAPRKDLLPTNAALRRLGRPAAAATRPSTRPGAQSPHAHAVETLDGRPQAGQPGLPALPHDRLRPPGRLPRDGACPRSTRTSPRVGCESCHGPGGDHVAEGAREDRHASSRSATSATPA